MKKIYLTLTLLSLLFSGCTRDNVQDEVSGGTPAENLVPVSFVTLSPSAVEDDGTRTMLNADNSVSWHSDDAVAYVTFDDPVKFTNAFSEGPVGVFTGYLPDTFRNEQEAFLVYPYREPQEGVAAPRKSMTSIVNGTYVIENLVIPPRQTLQSGTFEKGSNLSVAVVDWNDEKPLQFRNLCMLLRLNLKGTAAIKKIRLRGSTQISGTYQIEYLGDTAKPGEEFRMSEQADPKGNPETSETILLEAESEEGFQLTEEPQSIYVPAYVKSRNANMTFYVYVTTVENKVFDLGQITINAMRDPNVLPGHIASLGEHTVNGPLLYEDEISCDKDGHEFEINKTRHLADGYDVSTDAADSWFTATKTENGFKVNVAANTTGKARTGVVTVKRGDEILTTVNVIQQKFGYRDLLGGYMLINYTSSSSTGSWILNFKEAVSGQEDHYLVEVIRMMSFNTENYHPTFTVKYNAVGKTPLSLLLPQKLADYDGQNVNLYAMTTSALLCFDEGAGFDIRPTADEYAEGFYFSPNALAMGLYNLMKRLCLMVGDDNTAEDYIELRSNYKSPDLVPVDLFNLDGVHEGITPVN